MIKQQLIQFAARIDGGSVNLPKVNSDTSIEGIIKHAYMAAAITAVIVIIIAGIMYSSANGDPEKIKTAKNTILYTIIGLIVVILAFAIASFVLRRLA